MNVDSTGGIFAKAGGAADLLARTKSRTASGIDLSTLLGTGTNDPTGQNLPSGSPSIADLFKTLDTDEDGSINSDEFASLPAQFSANTMDQLLALQGGKLDASVKALVAAADRNKSGGLGLDELGTAAAKAGVATGGTDLASVVKGLDTDGNGELSSGEIRASIKPVRSHHSFAWQDLAGLGKAGAVSRDGPAMPAL
jgi:hypothetical protein